MKIRDRLKTTRDGKRYDLVAASDGKMQSVKVPEKGWQSFFERPEENYTEPEPRGNKPYKPLHLRRFYKACDLFLLARWPGFKQVYPNGITFKQKTNR